VARKTTVTIEDDLDGSIPAEAVAFGLDGIAYEIDLSAPNATRPRDLLHPYVSAGRPVRRLATLLAVGSASWSAQADREQLTAIRTWARHHGRPISARGPIPAAVVQAYLNAAGP
jgi:hypothetical protein